MTEQQLDNQGEAHEALNSVVADFGQRVLSDPRMLENRMSDLIPDLERERGLMVTAARSDVAGELTRRVQEQRLDPDTAVQLVSRSLSDRTSIDQASSMWITTQYAQALGYQVRSDLPSSPGPVPPPPPPPQETVTAYPPFGSPYQGTAPPQDPTIGAPGYGGYSQPQGPAGGGGYGGYSQPPPAGGGGYSQPPPAGGGYSQPPPGGGGYYSQPQAPPGGPAQGPPPWEAPARSPKRRNRGLIYGLSAGAAAIVIFLVAAFAGGLFKSSTPTPTPTPTISHTPKPTPTPTGPALAAGVAPLVQLLPSDVNPQNCKAAPKPGWATPGLVKSLTCYDSGVGSGDSIYAYQMDNSADYAASWANFNTFAGFSASSGSGCPPTGSNTQGSTAWDDTGSGGNGFYPAAAGQTLECGFFFANSNNQNEPTYAWSFPSEDAYVIAIGDANSTFSHLQSWWAGNADPNASPSPSTP